jgi:hypothetical protein
MVRNSEVNLSLGCEKYLNSRMEACQKNLNFQETSNSTLKEIFDVLNSHDDYSSASE